MNFLRTLLCALALLTLGGCASMFSHAGARQGQAGSVVDYLYPDAQQSPSLQPTVTRLRLPVRVGIAFVPGGRADGAGGGPSAGERLQLLERVKGAFSQYDFIGSIQVIPSAYLRPRGGFDNLDQVARMFNVDVVALVSYDQIRFDDVNRLAVLYWTVVGAYLVKGDRYDVQTMVDAAVFDVHSRKLLFRAPGISQLKGTSTLAGFSKEIRDAQSGGYQQAVEQLIPNLQAQLADFREGAKSDPGIQVERQGGGRGGNGAGGIGWPAALALAALAVWAARRRAHERA
jgi:rhombotail lipoprotein